MAYKGIMRYPEKQSYIHQEPSDTGGELFADSECPSDRLDEESRQDRCQMWVNSVHIPRSETSSPLDEYYKSYSEGYSSDSDRSIGRKRRKRVIHKDKLQLVCEWKDCIYETKSEVNFCNHVLKHIPHLELRVNDKNEEVYTCLWAMCDFETDDSQDSVRHVIHHSYHTKLKAIGSVISAQWNLPVCGYGSENKNLVPDLQDRFYCDWLDCGMTYNNYNMFIIHIAEHVNTFPKIFPSERCLWRGCKVKFRSRISAGIHVRTHTKEKVVACPNCGIMLASNSKFYDHCKRLIPVESSGYQCNHCLKSFAVKRLLREHMRAHINHYKCCYCDMTCSNPSMLSTHIRYKHLSGKPFACTSCGFACKTQKDLKSHMTTHNPENQFSCDRDGCDFSCRSKKTIVKHMIDVHQVSKSPEYCCHMPDCNKKFKRGAYLTKHLMEKHYLKWPSGHSKFLYRQEEDGCYRLQTLRYESLDIRRTEPTKIINTDGSKSPSFKVVRKIKNDAEVADFVIVRKEEENVNDTGKISALPDIGNKSKCKKKTVKKENKIKAEIEADNEVCTTPKNEVLISIEDEKGNVLDYSTIPVENTSADLPAGATLIAVAE